MISLSFGTDSNTLSCYDTEYAHRNLSVIMKFPINQSDCRMFLWSESFVACQLRSSMNSAGSVVVHHDNAEK